MRNNKGFTLVELMITVAMTGIIVGVVYATYTLQQKTATAQEQVTEMQQNIRSAVFYMAQDLRMAGYNPTELARKDDAGNIQIGITAASVSGVAFIQDITNAAGTAGEGDGDVTPPDPGESVRYGFAAADDADGNGVVDNAAGVAFLGRDTGGGLQAVAENIEALEFLYTEVDSDAKTVATTTAPADLTKIRAVTISILARAGNRDPGYVNTQTYTPASGVAWDLGAGAGVATNDNFRRRLTITTVQCRNMGLKENEINF